MHGQRNIKPKNCNLLNVARMRKREMHATFLVANPKGKRKLGRPTIISKDIIQMDHTEIW